VAEVFVERSITIDCGNKERCLEFMHRIEEELSSKTTVVAQLSHTMKLSIKVIGLEPDVKETIKAIRDLYAELVRIEKLKPSRGVDIDQLVKDVGKPIQPDILVEVLNRNGIVAKQHGKLIIADCDYSTLLDYAKSVSMAVERVSKLPLAYSAKKLVAAAVALTNNHPEEIVMLTLEAGLIDEEGNLRMKWNEALKVLLEYINSEGALP